MQSSKDANCRTLRWPTKGKTGRRMHIFVRFLRHAHVKLMSHDGIHSEWNHNKAKCEFQKPFSNMPKLVSRSKRLMNEVQIWVIRLSWSSLSLSPLRANSSQPILIVFSFNFLAPTFFFLLPNNSISMKRKTEKKFLFFIFWVCGLVDDISFTLN